MDKDKNDEHEDIEKKVAIFHILNGILAKRRNLNSQKRVSWSYQGFAGGGQFTF